MKKVIIEDNKETININDVDFTKWYGALCINGRTKCMLTKIVKEDSLQWRVLSIDYFKTPCAELDNNNLFFREDIKDLMKDYKDTHEFFEFYSVKDLLKWLSE